MSSKSTVLNIILVPLGDSSPTKCQIWEESERGINFFYYFIDLPAHVRLRGELLSHQKPGCSVVFLPSSGRLCTVSVRGFPDF